MAIWHPKHRRGSTARLALPPGDELLSVGRQPAERYPDYDFYTDSDSFHLKARSQTAIREWEVQRKAARAVRLQFFYLFRDQTPCANHCVFCFIDQLPPWYAGEPLF